MKTKKILAIVVSCLLLIGVAAGITASAADAPTVAVSEVNLSYEGAIRLLYTFDTENLAAGQTVKAVFSANADTKVADGKFDASAYDYVGAAFNMNGETAVYSGGISPTAMTAPIYVIPVVTDSADNVVAVGEKVCFSIYDYCMARLGGDYTPEQYLLYLATLNFGGSIQKGQTALGADAPANGYADECYVLSVMNGDGSVTEYKFEEPTEYQLVAPKVYNGKLFDSFVDNKGVKYEDADFNKLAVSLDKPGYTYVKAVYGDIDAVSATITAGNSATLPNPDSVTVGGGSEFWVAGEITLADGATATIALNPGAATVALSEADGVVTVSDGISSFTMKNGSALKVEYTVLSVERLTGVIFYYVNGEHVAKSDVTSTANSSFSGVTASVTAGEITIDCVEVGATSSIMSVENAANTTTATFELGENGKYLVISKNGQNKAYGGICFTYGGERKTHTVFETKMKLTGGLYNSEWRNYIDVNLQVIRGQYNVATPRIIIQKNSVKVNGVETVLNTPIADDGWFDIKFDVVSGSAITIYVNGQLVGTLDGSNGNKLGYVSILPSYDAGTSSISIMDTKFYTVE